MSEASLVYLTPARLTANGNVRRDLGDLSALVESIREHGVLEPLVVVPEGDDYRLIIGHRRCAAAVEAGVLVPCLVRPDLTDVAPTLAAQIVENEHRKDLTTAERVAAYRQLSLAGLSQAKIAQATGTKPAEVKRLLGVGQSQAATEVLAQTETVTLEQAAVLAEFDGDDEVLARLTTTLAEDPEDWDHELSRLRREVKQAGLVAARAAELAGAGVTVVAEEDLPEGATRTMYLTTADREAHSGCPGHVVVVLVGWSDDLREVAYCLDPAAYGHEVTVASGPRRDRPQTEEEKAAASEARRLVLANNKAWRAAEPVRRAFVKALLARKSLPKGALRFAVADVVTSPNQHSYQGEEVFVELWGGQAEKGWFRPTLSRVAAEVAETRLGHLLLAEVATAHEVGMHVNLWRSPDAYQARWLGFLADCGYTLSEVERLVQAPKGEWTGPPEPGDEVELGEVELGEVELEEEEF